MMKKLRIIQVLVFVIMVSCGGSRNNEVESDGNHQLIIEEETVSEELKPPYEAMWLEISKTDNGYVVYNYSSRWDDGKTIAPTSITVRNDSLIWADCFEPAARLSLKKINIEERKNGSYYFPVGNHFLFTWYDKKNHIAQWKIYGDVENDKPLSSYLYIDSRYNKYPIVDYEWGDEWEDE